MRAAPSNTWCFIWLLRGVALEIIYPTLGVKFVAIQERVDTETGEGTEMMPFHNIFNDNLT